jgi:hypothetical protein
MPLPWASLWRLLGPITPPLASKQALERCMKHSSETRPLSLSPPDRRPYCNPFSIPHIGKVLFWKTSLQSGLFLVESPKGAAKVGVALRINTA